MYRDSALRRKETLARLPRLPGSCLMSSLCVMRNFSSPRKSTFHTLFALASMTPATGSNECRRLVCFQHSATCSTGPSRNKYLASIIIAYLDVFLIWAVVFADGTITESSVMSFRKSHGCSRVKSRGLVPISASIGYLRQIKIFIICICHTNYALEVAYGQQSTLAS